MIKIHNWSSFQSYKDRKPPWIRLHKSLLDDFEFHSMSNLAKHMLFMLWLLASEDKDPVSGSIRYGYDKIAFRLRMTPKDVEKACEEISEAGFIQLEQPCNRIVTESLHDCHETVTPETETETETETEENTLAISTKGDLFQNLWGRYPNKTGKTAATRHYIASVKTKQDAIDIDTALTNYLNHLSLPQNSFKQYQNGSTWFNNWRDWTKWQEPAPRVETKQDPTLKMLEEINGLAGETTDRTTVNISPSVPSLPPVE
jgi:hypothetical protein